MRYFRVLSGEVLRYCGIFFLATFLIFTLLSSAPQEQDSFGWVSPDFAEKPFLIRYWIVLRQVITLDLGYLEGNLARTKILVGMIGTFSLLASALVSTTVTGLVLGLIFTYFRESRPFRTLHLLIDFMSLMPAYVLGYFVSLMLATQAGVTTDVEFARASGPALLLGLFALAAMLLGYADGTLTELIRQLQAELVKGRQARHMQAVRANDLNLARHMFRASLVPLLVTVNLRLVHLMGAVIVVEKIFTIKGLGFLTLEGIKAHNYLIVFSVSTILVAAVLVIHAVNAMILTRLNPLADEGTGNEANL